MQAMPSSKVSQRGLSYLRKVQRSSGGFALGHSGPANSQSTAWAAQGMIAVGADPASISNGGSSARDYLLARQDADGHFSYSSSSDQTPVWVTGQVLPAIAGVAFPVSPPPRAPTPQPTPVKPEGGSTSPSFPSTPGVPSIPQGLPPSSAGSGSGSGPGSGGSPPLAPPAATPGPPVPVPPSTEGDEPEAPPMPAFEAKEPPPGPKPWAPLGVGLGTGGLALGGVIFLGRRFGW
jgi:hypothetical protein